MCNSITIVEGPAGAGKSFYLKQLIKDYSLSPNQVIDSTFTLFTGGDRFPGKDQAPLYSLMSDTSKALQAWTTPGPVYIDRFGLSQFVYQRIREDLDQVEVLPRLYELQLSLAIRTLKDILKSTRIWVERRDSKSQAWISHPISLVLILPSLQDLKLRREVAGREFPYGLRDYVEYERLTSYLQDPDYYRRFGIKNVEVMR